MTCRIVIAALVAGLAGTGAMAQGMGPNAGPGGAHLVDLAALDADGDGSVTMAEVDAAIAARFAGADTNGDGGLSAEEISAWIEAERAARQAERQAAMIAELDTSGDGLLQADELPMLSAGLDRIFDRIDTDEDGAVTAEEFAAAQERMAERRPGPRDGDRHQGGPGNGPHAGWGGFWERFSG